MNVTLSITLGGVHEVETQRHPVGACSSGSRVRQPLKLSPPPQLPTQASALDYADAKTVMALDLIDGFNPANDREANGHDLPIFTVEAAQLGFSVTADFVAAQVANDVMILALSNGRILRIDLNRPEDIDGTCQQTITIHSLHRVLTRSRRHRPSQEDIRSWRHSPHVSRPHSVAPNHMYIPWRELLSALAVAAASATRKTSRRSD